MDPTCQECKQKAEFICFCNESYMCKGCRDTHKRKFKGPHKILLFNDPDLENIRNSFRNPKGGDKKPEVPVEKKKPEDPPALLAEKNKMKDQIRNEVTHLTEFQSNMVGSITDQAKSLIQEIISKYSNSTHEFVEACESKERALVEAMEFLNHNMDISSNPLLCKMLDFPDVSSIDLINLKSSVREEFISISDSLSLSVELIKFEESNQILEYFNANKESIPPPIKSYFEEVLSEKHFSTATIKINKVPLNKEPLAQLCMIIPQFPILKVLQLTENDLGNEGIKKLAPLLPSIQTLRKLMISKNALKGPGGKFLATYLKELKELMALDLSGNKFGLEGIKAICLSLQSLGKLKSLKLMNNSLGDDCTSSLVSCLPALKKLKTLRLGGNSFHPEEQGMIEEHVVDKCDVKF